MLLESKRLAKTKTQSHLTIDVPASYLYFFLFFLQMNNEKKQAFCMLQQSAMGNVQA